MSTSSKLAGTPDLDFFPDGMLLEHRWLFHSLLEALPDAVAIVDSAGTILHVNKSVEGLFGYQPDELSGQDIGILMPERFRTRHADHFEAYIARPITRRMGNGMELIGLRRDGSEFPIDVALSPIPGEAGGFVAAAIRDMSDYRQLEAQLRQRGRELEEADQHKDQFLAMLAHELRSPLAALSQVGPLLRLPAADERREWVAGVVERQTGHMVRLVEDLLDLAKVRRGTLALHMEPTELSGVVGLALDISRPLVESREHTLDIGLSPEPIWIQGDAARLAQVISNLLTNAARYTPVRGRITLDLKAEDGYAVLRIRDNGIGISADMLTRVFDLFTQVAPSDEQVGGGMGIGLALVRNLVEMHDGTVTASSEGPGLGSEFVVRIPLLGAGFEESNGHD